ncbi:MAG TPA: NAD(+)/NADH kinase [Desulfonatronum sp.]|nr:NAD(+)/NADH kinase [Desulfonatronum sp.]
MTALQPCPDLGTKSASCTRNRPDFLEMKNIRPQSVLLVAKKAQPDALHLAEEIAAWLNLQGMANTVTENQEDLDQCLPALEPTLTLVLGGDGTMISVARKLCGDNIALLGINFARVGFLTECPKASWRRVLEEILDHGVPVSPRMLLDVQVERQNEIFLAANAVNDIVVGRGNLARLIHLELFVEKERITGLHADGLILSTPTGSSAYSCSAGGPLIHPELDVVAVTPICPFLTEIKPFVLPADKHITVGVAENALEAYLTLDGQTGHLLQPGDRVHASGSSRRMLLAAIGHDSYFQKLKAKGFIQGA